MSRSDPGVSKLVTGGVRPRVDPRVSRADMSRDRFWRGEPVSAAR
jgi:hypothetical protein